MPQIIIMMISSLMLIFEIWLVSTFEHIVLWRYAIYWLPFIVITPGIVLILIRLMGRVSLIVNDLFSFIGKYSLEIYLLHMILLQYWKPIHLCLNNNPWLSFHLFLTFITLVSCAFTWALSPITKLIKNAA